MIYALDTNIVSFFMNGNEQVIANMRAAIAARHDVIIPPITYYEIRRGLKHKIAPAKERAFSIMCLQCCVGEMTVAAWEEAAGIYAESRRNGKPVEDADIINAAYCIVNGYTLVTNNAKHFENINGLSFVDWSKS